MTAINFWNAIWKKVFLHRETRRKETEMTKTATLQLEALASPTCMQKIEAAIKSVDGVDQDNVKVLFNASKAKPGFDADVTDADEIADAVHAIGYDVLKVKSC